MNDKVIQAGDKKCKVVMLPTEKASKLYIADGILFNYEKERKAGIGNCQNQHLYILSDEEIKKGEDLIKGEWYINTFRGASKPFQNDNLGNNGYLKKIIATTDTLLYRQGFRFAQFPLPQPSQQFITKYVEKYNKGNIITDVLVEWNNNYDLNYYTPIGGIECCEKIDNWKLVINKDNTINIKLSKDSWNRDELPL